MTITALTDTQREALTAAARTWLRDDPEGTTSKILDGGAYDDLVAEAIGVPSLSDLDTDTRREAWRIVQRIYDRID